VKPVVRPMRKSIHRLCVFVASFGLMNVARNAVAVPPPDNEQFRAELAQLRPQLEQTYAEMEKALRALDRERFDVQAVIEKVGRNPGKLFEWVRDQTSPLPYRGALRGSQGVLMERAGNSLDRSLLLSELLQGVGCDVRLANATLSPDQARALLQQI